MDTGRIFLYVNSFSDISIMVIIIMVVVSVLVVIIIIVIFSLSPFLFFVDFSYFAALSFETNALLLVVYCSRGDAGCVISMCRR